MKHLISILLTLSAGNFSWKTFQRQRFFRADHGLFSNAVNAVNLNIGNMRRRIATQKMRNPPPKCLIESLWKKWKKQRMVNRITNADLQSPSVRITRVGNNDRVKAKR